jgi:pimeloyl-ACP methyl ester carboxylesterase
VVNAFQPDAIPPPGPDQTGHDELATIIPFPTEEGFSFQKAREHYGTFHPEQEGVGKIIVVRQEFSESLKDEPEREHNLLTIEIDGYRHVLWVTEPVRPQDKALNVVAKPGLGEVVENGVGFEFHKRLAKGLPEARIISHATHGIGPHGDIIPWTDLPKHGLNQMAEQCLRLLEAYIPDEPIVLVGTSMGTVINNRLLNLHLAYGGTLNIEGVINYAPALVDPKNVIKDMALRFPVDLAIDGFKEFFTRTRVKHMLGAAAILTRSAMRLRDLVTMGRQIYDLMHGTAQSDVENVLANYPRVATIVGEEDPVGQVPMWIELEKRYSNLQLIKLFGRGHGIAMKPIDGARKVSETILGMDIYTTAA